MSNPPNLVIVHAQICNNIDIISEFKIEWPTFFLPLKVANDIVQFMNNNPNLLQTKVYIIKQGHMKRYNHVKSYAKKYDLQNENKMK
jgi:hypothetical protein